MLFAIAAGTDWVDGFWARRYGQITQLGRILDPFADKIIICGTFTFLAAVPPVDANRLTSASEIYGLDGRRRDRPRDARHRAAQLLRRARHRLLGQVVGQVEDGLPMRGRRGEPVAMLWYYGYRFRLRWASEPPVLVTWSAATVRLGRRRHDDLFRLGLRSSARCRLLRP